jgi:hypothetical protein
MQSKAMYVLPLQGEKITIRTRGALPALHDASSWYTQHARSARLKARMYARKLL